MRWCLQQQLRDTIQASRAYMFCSNTKGIWVEHRSNAETWKAYQCGTVWITQDFTSRISFCVARVTQESRMNTTGIPIIPKDYRRNVFAIPQHHGNDSSCHKNAAEVQRIGRWILAWLLQNRDKDLAGKERLQLKYHKQILEVEVQYYAGAPWEYSGTWGTS